MQRQMSEPSSYETEAKLTQLPPLTLSRSMSSHPYRIASSYGVHDDPIYCPVEGDRQEEGDDEDHPYGFNEIPEGFGEEPNSHALSSSRRNTGVTSRRQSATEAQNRRRSTLLSQKPPNVITWNGHDDPNHPRNWSLKQKWTATVIVSLFTFMAPVASSMIAPTLRELGNDLGANSNIEKELILTIFVLGFAVGPLIFGPLSEIYGRVRVLQSTNLFYLIFNIACGFATNKKQMLAFRFFSGVGGSGAAAIGGGILSDCWWPEQRGKAVAAYRYDHNHAVLMPIGSTFVIISATSLSLVNEHAEFQWTTMCSLAPLIGPAVGPIAGGFIAERLEWRYVFWISSIADGVIQVCGLALLRETYAPELLHRRARKLRKELGNYSLRTEHESSDRATWKIIASSIYRPFRMLMTQPIIQVMSVYMAFIYGMTYFVYASFSPLWMERYHESMGTSGLHYISLSIGFFLGTQIIAPLNDRIYCALKKKHNGIDKPEFRCPVMVPGAIFVTIGLFWYGWSAEAHLHWVMPDIGMVWFSVGCDIGFQSVTTYIVDSYTRYAASGVAATIVLRSLTGFGFPLFASSLYDSLGYGWGNSLLGFAAITLGLPAPFLLWKYGPRLRMKSPYAAGS